MPKKLILWRGYHQKSLLSWVQRAWEKQCVLIIVPMGLSDFSFMRSWRGDYDCIGEWSETQKTLVHKYREFTEQKREYPSSSGVSDLGKEGFWPEDCVIGLFTSGTVSGSPRLVLFTEVNLLSSLESIRALFDARRIQQIFCYPQPTHVFGLVLGYLQAYLYQLPLVVLEQSYSRDAHQLWLHTVNEHTLTLGTPTHFSDLISCLREGNIEAPPSYSCIVGGAPVGLQMWQRLRNELHIEAPSVGYGATEASLGITHLAPGVEPFCDSLIGELLPHVTIKELTEGGYRFAGVNVAHSIWDGQKFIHPEVIELKDVLSVVERNSRRYFIFEGRSDFLINRGGLKIAPEAVEGAIEAELGLQVMVLGFPNERLGEDVAILWEGDASSSSNSSNSLNSLKSSIENIQTLVHRQFSFRLSANMIVCGEIPKTAHGKKDRSEAFKVLIRAIHPKNKKLPIALIKSFMPHRSSAIWIDSLLDFEPNFGRAEVVVHEGTTYWPLQSQEAVEWVAQTYGYARVANDIYGLQKVEPASKTLIAEVKHFENLSPGDWQNVAAGERLEVTVTCTRDFSPLFIIEGQILRNKRPIAKLNMKVYAGL